MANGHSSTEVISKGLPGGLMSGLDPFNLSAAPGSGLRARPSLSDLSRKRTLEPSPVQIA
jgi:hypothetical protein